MLASVATISAEGALAELGTSPEGLRPEEAEARLRRDGPNRLPEERGPGRARELLSQMTHFFALMLWAAAGLAFIGGMPQLGWAIIAVVIVNGIFSFVQEYRAERATRALSALIPLQATVIRGGRKATVPAEDLVQGDLVLLREGDRISADARIVRSDGLSVDNATLTGESAPARRNVEPAASVPVDVAQTPNLVFAGTFVASGSALAAVVVTGARTRLGSIAHLTATVVRRPTPLHDQLVRAVRIIAGCAVGAGAVFFAASLGLGTPARDGFLFAVGVIVALVPEGLLPTLTLSLAMSATRMARRGALVRRLESVETLGSTTVICSDKTGTMTENQMTARAVEVAGAIYTATGTGYDPSGTLLAQGRPLTPEILAQIGPLLHAAALCGDARISQSDGRWRCVGDPTEGALVVVARKGGVDREAAEREAPRAREYPFESTRRRMSTAHALPSGEIEILVKGSPEAILAACSSVRHGATTFPLGTAEAARIRASVDLLAGDGLRVLALARRTAVAVPGSAEEAEAELELLGLVGMEDPLRPEVPDAVARCLRAGIRLLMVTGDHPSTAASIARKAGIPGGKVASGDALPTDVQALAALLADRRISILARVPPEQKLRIAEALQSEGAVVAMTGDGVNDAPALRRADIGVAMGVGGTDVARGAADLVLLDDNFAHIVEAVEEGRAAFDNVGRFLTYHLTDNVAELAPFVVWALSGGRIPLVLSVLQILALDIGTDLLPALALGGERPEAGTMTRPPRPRGTRLLSRRVLGRAFGFLGPVEAVASLAMVPLGAAIFFGWRPGQPMPATGIQLATLSTMVFAAIVMMQMANALECRSTPASLFAIGPASNRLLLGAIGAEALALLAFIYVPVLQAALGQAPIGGAQWALVAATPFVLLAAEEARKTAVRMRLRRRGEGAPA